MLSGAYNNWFKVTPVSLLFLFFSRCLALLFSHQLLDFIEMVELEPPRRTREELEKLIDRLFDRLRDVWLNCILRDKVANSPEKDRPAPMGAWVEQRHTHVLIAARLYNRGIGEMVDVENPAQEGEAPHRINAITARGNFDLNMATFRL